MVRTLRDELSCRDATEVVYCPSILTQFLSAAVFCEESVHFDVDWIRDKFPPSVYLYLLCNMRKHVSYTFLTSY